MFLKLNHTYRLQDKDEFGGKECLVRAPLNMNPKRWMHAYINTHGNYHVNIPNVIKSHLERVNLVNLLSFSFVIESLPPGMT